MSAQQVFATTSSLDSVNSTSNALIVSWSDRWLGCLTDGQKAFQRRWISLTDDVLLISYDMTDTANGISPIACFALRELELESDQNKFIIEVACGEEGCLFRCGEALEFAATWAALQRVTQIAKSKCLMCAELQRELDAHARDRSANQATLQLLSDRENQLADVTRQLKDCEAASAASKAQLEECRDQLAATDRRRGVAETRANAAEKAEREAKSQAKQATDDAAESQRRAAAVEKEALAWRQELDQATQQVTHHEGLLAQMKNELELREASFRSLESQVVSMETQNQNLRSTLEKCESERDRIRQDSEIQAQELQAGRQRIEGYEGILSSTRQELAVAHKDLERSDALLREYQTGRATLEHDLALLQDEIEARVKHEEQLQSQSVAAQELHAAELDVLQRELSAINVRCSQLTDDHRHADGRARTLEERLVQVLADMEKERSSTALLVAEATQRRQLRFVDACTETQPFRDCVAESPEMAQVIAERVLHQRHVDRCAVVARIADALAALSNVAVVELDGVVRLLQDATSALSDPTAAALPTSPTRASPARRSGSATMDGKPSANLCIAMQNTMLDGTPDWPAIASKTLDTLQSKVWSLVDALNQADSPLGRALTVAREAGYLDAIAELDVAVGLIEQSKARDAVMEHLRGPGAVARALASSIISGPRGQRNAAVETLCQSVDSAFCSIFDKCVKSAALRGPGEAAWLRNVARVTSQARTTAQRVICGDPTSISESQLEECLRDAAQVAETIKSLQGSEFCRSHALELHEALGASWELQHAVFLALRRFNRSWLRHHLCAESIARFGLQLKRAGTLLDKAKIRGSEPYAQECLAAWPIVKHLVELPRRMLDEDRAFQVMWESIADHLKPQAAPS